MAKIFEKSLPLIVAVLLASTPAALGEPTALDLNHTSTYFTAKHLLISSVPGYIPVTSAKMELASGNIPSSIEAVMDLNKIDTHNERRDNDLRSERFLDVARYPEMTFKSTKITPGKRGTFTVNGDLTIRGVTKPVVLSGSVSEAIKDDKGRTHVGYAANSTIDRTEWGIGATIPPAIVSKEIAINIEAEAILQ